MPNAKRKIYTMPRLRQQNKSTDTGGYRAKEFSPVLSQELKNFPLFCPKCHKQTLINAKQLNITTAEVPDAKTQADEPVRYLTARRLFFHQ